MRKFFALMILSTIIFFTACGNDDSPENALEEIKIALAEKNLTKLSERVNMDEFFSATYDAATVELAKNYDVYKAKYPDDPYFQHSAEFLTNYNAKHKDLHLKFLDGVKAAYFAKIPAPENPQDNPAAYVANEFELIRQATNVTIKEIHVKDNRASVLLEISGDNSLRGQFIGQMTFKLAFHREKKIWHFDAIENLDELTPNLVGKAEIIWITFF